MKFECEKCDRSFEIEKKAELVKFCIYCGKPLADASQQMRNPSK